MNISKLFHWLYAILLLLPIAIFLPTGLYYAFNEHATAEEKTEKINVPYETNNINTYEDFVSGNVYSWNNNYIGTSSFNESFNIAKIYVLSGEHSVNKECYMSIYTNGTLFLNTTNEGQPNINLKPMDFIFLEDINMNLAPNALISHFGFCPRTYIKYTNENIYNMSIVDSMQTAWQDTWETPLFNWSYNSFLNAPIQYLGNLFGIPQNSSILAPLSYWLAISVIWLVFDLIMYVPLLAHRWIDKARLE